MRIKFILAGEKLIFSGIALILASLLMPSCNPSSSSNNQQRNLGETQTVIEQEKDDTDDTGEGNSSTSTGSATGTKIYLSPFEARVAVERDIVLEESKIIEDYKVPSIKITFDKSDFVQILRCAASYKMTTLTGEDIRHLAGRPGQREALEWAWAKAVEDRYKCKFVGKQIVSKDFRDLAAPKGEYYYVINPCVLSENSVLKKEGCSYKLALTYPVKVTASFKQEILAKTQEVSEAEAAVNASILEAQHLAKKIQIHLEACENMVAKDNALNSFKQGLVQLGTLVVTTAIGGAFGGPNGAVLMGTLVGTYAGTYLYSSVLGLPEQIANECVDPTVVATTEEQRKEASKLDGRYNPGKIFTGEAAQANSQGQVGKYEEEYQVQALTRQLQKMLDPETGAVALATNRLHELLKEMLTYDLKILSIDSAFAEAANQGIDFEDTTTFPQEF